MRTTMLLLLTTFLLAVPALGTAVAQQFDGQAATAFPEVPVDQDPRELNFIGYYFMKGTFSNMAPTNEFLKGQVVGRLFGDNTTATGGGTSNYTEQRFIPMFTYSPRLFDGWAKVRASMELDWTWGDANYGVGGNFGGGFGADYVNMQTQNLFLELRPRRNLFINAGLQRLFDNVRVPWYTFTEDLIYKGYRLALFGSDATGLTTHYMFDTDQRLRAGFYQLYENNVEQPDDVTLYLAEYERDLSIESSAALSFYYLKDRASGEGGVSSLRQGLDSQLADYNGVFRFEFNGEPYEADIFWLGANYHNDPLLRQGDTGMSAFAFYNLGEARTDTRTVDIGGMAANLRVAHRWGARTRDQIILDSIYTSGDDDGISDGTYSGVLTGNNYTTPGAVYFSHGLYLLMPHGNVVNRFIAATMDIQNMGYGISATSLQLQKEFIPNKLRAKVGGGVGYASATPSGIGSQVGSEINFNLCWTMKVYMDLELHAAYMWLGDFYDSPVTNGGLDERPDNPWTVFATFKWISF